MSIVWKFRWTFLVVAIASIASLVGCGSHDTPAGAGLSPINEGATTIVPATSAGNGPASIRFRLLTPEGARKTLASGIKGNGTNPASMSVTFTLKLIDLTNPANPVATLTKSVPVVGEKAEVSFIGLPTRTIIAAFDISGGQIMEGQIGYASWRGAADLIPGTNTVDLAPRLASMTPDLVAQVLEDLLARLDPKAVLLPKLARNIRNVIEFLGPKNTSYKGAFDSFIAQLGSSVSVISLGGQFTAPRGGTFAAGDAASVRSGSQGNIRAGSRSRKYSARLTANPGKPNQVATVSTNLVVSDDLKTLTLEPVSVQAPVGKSEVVIEILPATFTLTTTPIFKGYDVQPANPPDQPASPAIIVVTPASTAQALAYDQWKTKDDAFNQNIEQFLVHEPDIASLTAKIEAQLVTIIQEPVATFTWPTEVVNEAKVVASETIVVAQRSTIDGFIRDNDSGRPIIGAMVGIAETELYDITDETGYFQLPELASGTYDLVIKRDGYAPVTYGGVTVTASMLKSARGLRHTILVHE
ncbi:MAG: carboxypeptidase regulatory-like domain-containing protein [Candidatus Ozemobacteraceae bacterium]